MTSISYALKGCDLGLVLAAQSERGVCAIFLGGNMEENVGENARELVAELRRRFPKAVLSEGGAAAEAAVEAAVRLVEKPGRGFPLPLDLRGTPFQLAVWEALRGVPAGATVSYSEVARRIGRPRAVRAVGRALRANPLAVAVPCHRVVGADGGLTGYYWGLERKRRILEREGVSLP